MLERRYGRGLVEHHRRMFGEAGLPYAGTIEKVPNSRRALMLGELARDQGVFENLHPRLFDAYWGRGLDIGEMDVLVAEGTAAGLGEEDIVKALGDERYLGRIREQTEAAFEVGASGVPAWLIDERVLVPGAQPHDIFERVLERLGHLPPGGSESPIGGTSRVPPDPP